MTRQLKSRPSEYSGWTTMPGQPRTCSGCGEKLTLNSVEPLWFDTMCRERVGMLAARSLRCEGRHGDQ